MDLFPAYPPRVCKRRVVRAWGSAAHRPPANAARSEDRRGCRGRGKGRVGVERACHTGQHRSLQSVCVTQKIGCDLGSRVLSSYNAASV